MMHEQTTAAARLRIDELLADCRARTQGIGFVGPDVPVDVLLASGRPFGHLPWEATAATPWADQWLESSFPYWARSILEQWHDGRFDSLDTIVFSRADDASQRLYYYIAELKRRGKLRGPSLVLFDIALVPRETSLLQTEAAVVELMRVLDVSRERLRAGIERANRLRASLAGIERRRESDGPLYERLGRAAAWSDPTPWVDGVGELFAQAGSADGSEEIRRRRFLLAGSVPVDDRLHRAVEDNGASIVAEAHVLSSLRLGAAIAADVAAVESVERTIARHLRQSSVAPRAFRDRASWIVERAVDARADAVVLWLMREDEAFAWQLPLQRRSLAACGIATLVLPAARWQADDGTLDRIAGFCREETAHATA